jgi:hypothetical protein
VVVGASREVSVRRSSSAAAPIGALAGLAFAGIAMAEPSLVVSGACRDGVPNGAYEVRDRAGKTRVVGAFAKGRRTGTFIFWSRAGVRVAVVPYEGDAMTGTVALWHPPRDPRADATRKLEAPYTEGQRHGVTRAWHDNGRARAVVRYERGSIVEVQAWRRDGRPMSEAEARALAQRDERAAAQTFATLERVIADHSPSCTGEKSPDGRATF